MKSKWRNKNESTILIGTNSQKIHHIYRRMYHIRANVAEIVLQCLNQPIIVLLPIYMD